MIEQIGQDLTFDAFYTLDGVGVAGLTVTVDVWRGSTLVSNNVAATAVGGGFYTYTLPGASVTVKGHYRAKFKTEGEVDTQQIAALQIVGPVWAERIDATISSRLASADFIVGDVPAPAVIASYVRTELTAELARIDTTISSRLAAADYIAPDNTLLNLISSIVSARLDTTVSSRLAAASYVAPNNAALAELLGLLTSDTFDGLTFAQVMKVMMGVMAGKTVGWGTPNVAFRNVSDAFDRVSALMDVKGNRLVVTLNLQ
jgi:hypothetical protein